MNALNAAFVFLCLSSVTVEVLGDGLIVKLNHGGEIRGSTLKSQEGRTIYAFRGIPYAEPPTGALRFKGPVPKSAWKGKTFDATKDGPVCPQKNSFDPNLQGHEDCLYLNVYTTKPTNNQAMAVMVFIHGGAFALGSAVSADVGPGLLLDEEVILVAMNYRLGPLGFLSTGDSASPGNYGLMDQSLALQWVKENIDVFGGDANKITLFGESAGAGSVGFHLLSNMSAGIFQNAIAQSGNPLCYWALQKNPIQAAKALASEFECPTENTFQLVECLRKIPDLEIVNSPHTYKFAPTVDGTFLTMTPKEVISSGQTYKVPYLSGINKDEGLLNYVEIYLNSNMSDAKHATEATFTNLFSSQATKLMIEKYFSKVDWSNEEDVRKAIVKALSDVSFGMPHYEIMKLLAQEGFTTYTYSLDYEPSFSLTNALGIDEKWGVGHADDLSFLFDGKNWLLTNATADDKKIMKVFCSLWANFAKYSNPTPQTSQVLPLKWEPSTSTNMNIYHINIPITTTGYNPDKDDFYHLWTETLSNLLTRP